MMRNDFGGGLLDEVTVELDGFLGFLTIRRPASEVETDEGDEETNEDSCEDDEGATAASFEDTETSGGARRGKLFDVHVQDAFWGTRSSSFWVWLRKKGMGLIRR